MAPYEPGAYFSELGGKSSTTPKTVTVAKGDTLSSIAKNAGTTVKEILAANPKFTENPKYKGGNLIFSGTTVKIPGKGNPLETALPVEGTPPPPPPPPPPTPEPITPSAVPISTPTATVATPIAAVPVKTAPIDTVLFDKESVPIEVMTDLIFENIGGHELINIARNDIVNGQQVIYQPIKNLSSIQQQYNPNNILSLQSTSDKYFANFSIKLENKIPDPGSGPNGSYVYLDNNTGNLVIEAINLELDEQIEAEITVSGTIYEAEFGESNS
jgi:hypothetical protein